MKEIIEILMRRDHLSELEARNIIHECLEALKTAIRLGNYDVAEMVVEDYLGLEPDYLDILLMEVR